MSKAAFLIRMQPQLKEAIRDRAKLENRSQNSYVTCILQKHLLENPYKQKTAS